MEYLLQQDINVAQVAILLWMLPWKGFALWRAAQANHKRWFIVLLVVNLFGILEIIYLLAYNKKAGEPNTQVVKFLRSKAPFLK